MALLFSGLIQTGYAAALAAAPRSRSAVLDEMGKGS